MPESDARSVLSCTIVDVPVHLNGIHRRHFFYNFFFFLNGGGGFFFFFSCRRLLFEGCQDMDLN